MRFFTYILCVLLVSFDLLGQSAKELKHNLLAAKDSAKVNILNQLGELYLETNIDSAIYYFNQAGKVSEEIKYLVGATSAIGGKGFAQMAKGNNDKAAAFFRQALKNIDSLNIKSQHREDYLLGLARAIKETSPLEATKLGKDALAIYQQKEDKLGQISALSSLGQIYHRRKNYLTAIDQYSAAIDLARSLNKNKLIGENLIRAAELFYLQENTAKALEYYYQAIDIGDNLNDKDLAAGAKLKVAHIYHDQRKYQQAIGLYLDVLKHYNAKGDVEGQMNLNYFIGLSHKNKRDPKTALIYFFKAHKYAKDLGNKKMMAKNYNERARSYLNLGKVALATKNANWSVALSQKEGFLEELMYVNLIYSDIKAVSKKYAEALVYYKRYSSYRDKLFKEQKDLEMMAMENEFESRGREIEKLYFEKEKASQLKVAETEKKGRMAVDEKNNELFQLNAKNDKLKNNTLIGSMILLLLFSLGTILAYKNKLDDNKILINQKDEILKQKENLLKKNKRLIELNEEKDNLVNMVAHDLRSPLDQIKGLVNVINMNSASRVKGKNQEYIDMISYATERMRSLIGRTLNIRNIDKQEIDPQDEVFDVSKVVDEVLNNFVELANRKNLTIHSELQRNGCVVKADINYMVQILENLISNAIKFSQRGKGIRVKAGKYNNLVRVEVIDQGPGIREEDMPKLFKKFQRLAARPTANEDSTGLGLSIVKRFVESMGGEVRCESTFGEGANFIVEFNSHDPEV